MKRHLILAAMATAQLAAGGALAQPADLPIPAAVSNDFPAGISLAKTKNGTVYVDAKGHTLYGMDLRTLIPRTANGLKYCQGPCLDEWEPLLAPPGAKTDNSAAADPYSQFLRAQGQGQGAGGGQAGAQGQGGQGGAQALAQGQGQGQQGQGGGGGGNNTGRSTGEQQAVPDWSIVDGPKGPQWAYKRWHLVYVHKGDKPGQTDKDGYDDHVWNTLKYVPPAPKLVAPTMVASTLQGGSYVLTDKQGHVLFTGKCGENCRWVPLEAGAAGRGIGEWTVDRSGDTPQWLFRGKPVFVSQEDDPLQTPASATALRP
jgi:predicted lipoprotein with Yx(FWY)xxD motif